MGGISLIEKQHQSGKLTARERLELLFDLGTFQELDIFVAASRGYVDAIIPPRETRPRIIRALEMLKTKQENRPWKKHGNIPV